MAVTALAATQLAIDTFSADLPLASGTAIDAAKTMEVAYPQNGKLVLRVNNSTAGAKNLTVSAGAFLAKGQGDLVQAFAQDDERFIVVSQDRFLTAAGKLSLSFETGMTGFVQAYLLP